MSAIISGIGVYYPETVLTNQDLSDMVETSDEWIRTRTGIQERRILPKDSALKTSDLGVFAAQEALEDAGCTADDIDGIIVSSIYNDKSFPATACFVQQKLGAKGFAFDITAACAGLVYMLNLASALIASGQCRRILVIGSECLSKVVDWSDRNTCVLFGDAAGAIVVSHTEDENRGFLTSHLESDGKEAGILYLDSSYDFIKMEGKSVFKSAVAKLSESLEIVLKKCNYQTIDLDLALFHQANFRILTAVRDKLKLTEEQVISNVHRFGNTSSASLILLLKEAQEKGLLTPGKLISLAAIGGGLSWGCNLLRW